MYKIEEIKELLKDRLNKKRYIHSLNVADVAKKLALKWDGDADKAYFAGLVHDICKNCPLSEQKQMVQKSNMNVTEEELEVTPLWHAISGAWYVEHVLGVSDKDILNAVRYHTCGRANMSLLEKIIFIADLISDDRDYKDVEKVRKMAFSDLDKTIVEGLKYSICDVVNKESKITVYTIQGYNYYLNK